MGVYLLYKSGEMLYSSKEEMIGLFGFILTLIFGFLLFGSIVVIISHINTKSALEHEQAQYTALIYKRDHIMNENNSKEIIDEIQEWNTNLIYKKECRIIFGSIFMFIIFMMNLILLIMRELKTIHRERATTDRREVANENRTRTFKYYSPT